MSTKLTKNVEKFILTTASSIAELEKLNFIDGMMNECIEYPNPNQLMESPIEQLLYVALSATCKVNGIKIADTISTPHGTYVDGLYIEPQRRLGKYRVDFYVAYTTPYWNGNEYQKKVIVECDSQKFHERTEKERRYEKRRDRFFASENIHVFHFTGTEIHTQPFRVAAEIIAYLVPWLKNDYRRIYDPALFDEKWDE